MAPNQTGIITSYEGIKQPYFPNYKASVTVTCLGKLPEKAYYFTKGNKYNIQSISRDPNKKYGRIFKTSADIYNLNDLSVKERDNLGHVYWYVEDHWYWKANRDEIWYFEEFSTPVFCYVMLQVTDQPIVK